LLKLGIKHQNAKTCSHRTTIDLCLTSYVPELMLVRPSTLKRNFFWNGCEFTSFPLSNHHINVKTLNAKHSKKTVDTRKSD